MRYSTKPPVKWELHYLDNHTKKYCILAGLEDTEAKAIKVLWEQINNHKGEAIVWLNHFVPFYKRKCEENELDWEANHSDLMDNYGDWSD